jgi:DNA-binding transcriptional regulator YiaG
VSSFDAFRAKQAGNSWEDSEGRTAERIAEPLIVKMGPGRNYYTRKQFNAIATYLLEPEESERAIERGKFKMGTIEILFTPHLREDRKVSAAALAKITKTPERTLQLWFSESKLPCVVEGREKMYDIDSLRDMLGGPQKNAL